MTLTLEILDKALALGFDRAAVVPLARPRHGAHFAAWLEAGFHGEMAYMAKREVERLDPARLAPVARSAIVVALNYNPGPLPPQWNDPGHGRFARYTWGPDYHDLVKPRLFALDAFIKAATGREAHGKACVDTAPILERDFAEQSGLGFIGRNTCLISPGLGSWTVLGMLLVPEVLEAVGDPRSGSAAPDVGSAAPGCGRCTRCLTACPTGAFAGPNRLDARLCISYLTIELRGAIPRRLRPLMGNWVFGCDVCQEACPYNPPHGSPRAHLAQPASMQLFVPEPVRAAPALLELLALDEAGFRARFRGTAVLRAKRRGLVRNACIAAGNWGDPAAVPALAQLLSDVEPLVRGHAAWGLGRIGTADALATLAHALASETDGSVREEIGLAVRSDGSDDAGI